MPGIKLLRVYIDMCSNQEKHQGSCSLIPSVLLLLIALFACIFLWFSIRPEISNICRPHTIVETKVKLTPQDSANFISYTQRLDSIQGVLADVRDQYQMDINIGIDRLNSWIGFWLAIFAMLLGLAGYWQYIQVRRHDSEWDNYKSEWGKKKKEIEEKCVEVKNEKKKLQEEQNCLKSKLQLENTIFNLLRTMTAIHDPLMILHDDNRLQITLDYLSKIQELLQQYAIEVIDKLKTDTSQENACFIYLLILTNFRLTLCRSLVLFTTPAANMQIRIFLEYVENEEEKVRNIKKLDKSTFKVFNEKLGELIGCLKRR